MDGFCASVLRDNHEWEVVAAMAWLKCSNQQLKPLKGKCLDYLLYKQTKVAEVLNEGEGNLKKREIKIYYVLEDQLQQQWPCLVPLLHLPKFFFAVF